MSEQGTTILSTEEYVELLEIRKAVAKGDYLSLDSTRGCIHIYGDSDQVDQELLKQNEELGKRLDYEEENHRESTNLRRRVQRERDDLEETVSFYKNLSRWGWGILGIVILLILIF